MVRSIHTFNKLINRGSRAAPISRLIPVQGLARFGKNRLKKTEIRGYGNDL